MFFYLIKIIQKVYPYFVNRQPSQANVFFVHLFRIVLLDDQSEHNYREKIYTKCRIINRLELQVDMKFKKSYLNKLAKNYFDFLTTQEIQNGRWPGIQNSKGVCNLLEKLALYIQEKRKRRKRIRRRRRKRTSSLELFIFYILKGFIELDSRNFGIL